MILGITGTQDGMTEEQFVAVRSLMEVAHDFEEVHGGDCIGFDAEFVTLVKEIRPDIRTVGHPPKKSNKRAFLEYDELRDEEEYLDRNHSIVDESDYLLACPKTFEEVRRSGTWATIRYARKKGKTVIIVQPDGTWASRQ